MATTQRGRLNTLYTQLAPGTPLTSEDLAILGISADLAVHYVRAGWLERMARGVYCRPNDPIALHPSLTVLQRSFGGCMSAARPRSTGMASATTCPSGTCFISTAGRRGACPRVSIDTRDCPRPYYDVKPSFDGLVVSAAEGRMA
jgi:hypothetical protein